MKYVIYEVQQVVDWQQWLHTVEADSEEEAMEKLLQGESAVVRNGSYGEESLEQSGFSFRSYEDAADKMEV